MNDKSELTDDERCIHSIFGSIRFDAAAVARALRSRPLTPFEAHGLANLLENNRPDGLHLKMVGQGRNWIPVFEKVARYERCMEIAKMVEQLRSGGESWEQAILATAECFSVSEPTVARAASVGKRIQCIDK